MSILTIRSLLEKKGCQVILIVVMALVAIGLAGAGLMGLFSQGGPGQGVDQSPVVLKAGGSDVRLSQVADRAQALRAQFDGGDPRVEFNIIGQAIQQTLAGQAARDIADANGITITPEAAKDQLASMIDEQIQQARLTLQMTGQVEEGATEQEISEAFRGQYGQTPQEVRDAAMAEFDRELERDEAATLNGFLPQVILDSYASRITPTDEEVKSQFDSFSFRILAFDNMTLPAEEREKTAEEAKAQLDSGKAFAEVYKQYKNGEEPPAAAPYSRTILESQPTLEGLMDLEAGETSDVINQSGVPILYHLEKVEQNLPEDFEENKGKHLSDLKMAKAQVQFSEEIEAKIDVDSVEWKSDELKLFYRVYQAQAPDSEKTSEDMAALADEANIVPEDAVMAEYLALARFSAIDTAKNLNTEPDMVEDLRDRWLDAAESVMEYSESASFRQELATELIAADRGEEASDQLVIAVQNVPVTDEVNEQQVDQIQSFAENAAALSQADKDRVSEAVKEWKKLRAEEVAYEKEMEEERKKLDEEMAKEEEQMLKEEAERDKAAQESGEASDSEGTTEEGE